MSTITKQWLQQKIADMEAARDEIPFGLGEDDSNTLAALRFALASLEAEPYGYVHKAAYEQAGSCGLSSDHEAYRDSSTHIAVYAAPQAPVSVPESAPVAYIFKHPAGRLFWSLTDESNKGQSDVMPVYSTPVPAFVPPAIEPDYEVIKGILPTANPDEYACCIAADMWNACRAAMIQGAEPVSNRDELPDDFDFDRFNDVVWLEAVASNPHMHSPTTSTIAMVALELNKRLDAGNSPVIPDGWVACSERMPDNGNSIVFWHPVLCEYCIGEYDTLRKCFKYFELITEDGYSEDQWYFVDGVTHWMPLPAKPNREVL